MINKTFFRHLLNNPILVALLVLALGWLLIEIKEVVVVFFISYIIMAAITPAVALLTDRKVPKALAAGIIYLLILAAAILLVFPLVPFFSAQIASLFKGFPTYVHNAAGLIGVDFKANELQQVFSSDVTNLGRNALQFTSRIFGGLFTMLTIVVLSFYLLLNHEQVKKSIVTLFAPASRKTAYETIEKVEDKLGSWLRGQIILSLLVGLLTWVGLVALGIEYALPLALIAGLLEIIPTIGPIVSAVPGIIVALSISPTMALIVAGLYLLIQQIENHLLVPRVMQRAVGLNPIVIILGIIIGGKLLGILGALLAVPFISLIVVVASHVQEDSTRT